MNTTVGRIVHFNVEVEKVSGQKEVEVRAAIITCVHSDTLVNLQVFKAYPYDTAVANEQPSSVNLGTGVGQWNWPPRVG